jgi:bifunctional N-acetylglucosamine-1-phosphate-uridyltransferase/glucosamine-1-phosphate-acetyltransferase GlmU-like protein
METSIKPETLKVRVKEGADDVFVLLLMPELPAFKLESPLEVEICGRSILNWTRGAVAGFPNAEVAVKKSDDIMSLVAKHAGARKYTAVVYADTPLLTAGTLEQAVDCVRTYGHRAAKMPRGWIFETEVIKNAEEIAAEDIPNLTAEDFIVAYNYSQVALLSGIMRGRIAVRHLAEGVQIADPNTAYIDADVKIGRGTVIEHNVTLKGETEIAAGAKILAGSCIEDSEIGKGARIIASHVVQTKVGADTAVGPYANLRAGNKIGSDCKIKNFVEIKNSTVGDGTKIAHMTYVGDAKIGKNCNLGCGVVFCNYNGKTKAKCTLGDNVFIGSNSNLVAPLEIDDNAYIAAGSTITQDVPANALAIARARQSIKEDWTNRPDTEGE